MSTITLGTRGTYQRGDIGLFPGVVTHVNDDGTVDVRADDGGQVHEIEVKERGTQAPDAFCFIPD